MVNIEIDGIKCEVAPGKMIIEAADALGITIPRFCYHKKLSIAANCRMCLVEVAKAPKPLPACATPVAEGMQVFTESEKTRAAQKAVMEFLLINHPLDCPICDQGGQCELQDVAMEYGQDFSQYQEGKRVVKDKNIGPLISTDMTRCIHCTRCVRFGSEIAGQRELGVTGRGEFAEIGTYVAHTVSSELSGNVIDLCPVGALTSKPFRFLARAWELQARPSISAHEPIGSHVFYHRFQGKVIRTLPREKESLNEVWLSDRDRFGYEGFHHPDRLTQPWIKRNNHWEVTDWTTAMKVATDKLGGVLAQDPTQVGALVSPNATVEECYLLQKLLREVGSSNIDYRLRQLDTAHEHQMGLFPQLGISLGELAEQQAVILIGSHIRKEQPLVAHRIRQATQKHGCRVFTINPAVFEHNFAVEQEWVVADGDLLKPLQDLVNVFKDQETNQETDPKTKLLMKSLKDQKVSVILGDYALTHPQASQLYALGYELAQLLGASFGELSFGANSAGAAIAGALPHRLPFGQAMATPGLSANAMLQQGLKGYILLHCEPAFDCADPQRAQAALRQAQAVVALTCFDSPELREVADVLLPVTPMSEMEGTYVNAFGDWQRFQAAVHPLGESKPAWKVIRVMGNLWEVPGFTQESAEALSIELEKQYTEIVKAGIQTPIAFARTTLEPLAANGLRRLAPISLYGVDGIVRRAKSLQATPDAQVAEVRLSEAQAKALGFTAGQWVWVHQGENKSNAPLPIVFDNQLPMGVAMVAAAIPQTVALGAAYGAITLSSAQHSLEQTP